MCCWPAWWRKSQSREYGAFCVMSGLQIRRRKRPELNLVPLIDVLVMLVFFAFVTMQFRSPGTLNITLPRVETAGKNAFGGTVILGIGKEGELTFATD
ncbi:MAG: biopolymer transporter ExbD, partial [Planctomycetes bacterium]|nr:biopolymer transporter ExbD [Planctomycetota bacterium]